MNSFEEDLHHRIQEIRDAGLYRELRRMDSPQGPDVQWNGRQMINFSSNDYLGLANHPAVKEASIHAVETFGAGSGASRLICGSLAPHHELETSLAAFKNTQAALAFSSGYATALGTIQSLLDPNDFIIIDKKVHACVVDAARLSPAKLRVFAHNDPQDLERILQWTSAQSASANTPVGKSAPRTLIVTESVFSMDGNLAPLREIVELKNQYGAWLMLDEAHATGLYGENRRGLAEAFELADQVEIQMGTLGKALGASGGYICGSQTLIDFLINKARSFIFSTAPTPATSAAASRAIQIIQSQEGHDRRKSLWILVDRIKSILLKHGWTLSPTQSAILPLHVGQESAAINLAKQFLEKGMFIPAIRYPTVGRGQARLRCTMTAAHTMKHLQALDAALAQIQPKLDLSPHHPPISARFS